MKKIVLFCAMLPFAYLGQAQTSAQKHIMRKSEMSQMTSSRQHKSLAPTSGNRVVVLNENFEGVSGTLPIALPAGWATNTISATDVPTVPAFRIHNS